MADPILALDYARLGDMLERLVAARAGPPLEPADDPVVLRAEYLTAVDIIKSLSDVRFRCLVFVTAIAAAANAFVSKTTDAEMRPALGLLGFIATLGITVYELRNSQLYEAAMHRAKYLETRLKVPASVGSGSAGLFSERPTYVLKTEPAESKNLMRFWSVQVQHDRGLALIYGAALGSWSYLGVYGLLALKAPSYTWWPTLPSGVGQTLAGVVAAIVGFSSVRQFVRHDALRRKNPRPPS